MEDFHRIGTRFLLLLFLLSPIVSQTIPAEQDGFWYQGSVLEEKSVLIETFVDPVCPDSRDSWPPLKKALERYGSHVRLIVHTFTLPYHDNSFATSQALHIVNALNSSATFTLLEAFYNKQEIFYNEATSKLSREGVINKIVNFVGNELGSSYNSAVEEAFLHTKSNLATRVSFKIGCLRGVYGTPFFFVNGFPLANAGSALDYKEWRDILDPLVGKRSSIRKA